MILHQTMDVRQWEGHISYLHKELQLLNRLLLSVELGLPELLQWSFSDY